MIWSDNFSKDTYVIFLYFTFKIIEHIVNLINFYYKKKVSPLYSSYKKPSYFSLYINKLMVIHKTYFI